MPHQRGVLAVRSVRSALAIIVLLIAVTVLVSCADPPGNVEQLHVEVLATLAHDPTMYTEGLEIHDGMLYEGSGWVGQSRVRALTLPGLRLLRESALPAPMFGEGITVTGARLWQLTWEDGVAIERDPVTLAQRRQVHYRGQGWGLCHDERRLVMSDGSDRLTFRDPVTFAPTGQVQVRLDGKPVRKLNELECTGDAVWANIFETDRIVRIDPSSGAVTGVVDASDLLSSRPAAEGAVLNGIAAIPDTDEFLLTGKYWPALFRVRFVATSR